MSAALDHARPLLRVVHTTRLVYDAPVAEACTEVRKTPVDTGLQSVITTKLEVGAGIPVRTHHDYFGNVVQRFSVLESHTEVVVQADSVIETTDAIACGSEAAPDPRPWAQRLAEFVHWSPAVPPLACYRDIPNRVVADMTGGDFLMALEDLGEDFFERFRYDPLATDVHSSPAVLFERGGGVCQDLAHAMIGVLRSGGVPARYASGYLYDPHRGEPEALLGTSASHAWVQVFHPELGWVGIDPTNRKLVDWQYVRVAVGRDYTDVQPLRGVFRGSPGQQLSVAVQVSRLR